MTTALPILYSFRRCPYAMRARLALDVSEERCELREVVLRDKPADLLRASAKGTVPVVVLSDGTVVDESIDIMMWTLRRNDPERWLIPECDDLEHMLALVHEFDEKFKEHLDRYKYPNRFAGADAVVSRGDASGYVDALESRLMRGRSLFGDRLALADIAIAPFVRQFARVDSDWFAAQGWTRVHGWLASIVDSTRFKRIMRAVPAWKSGSSGVAFPFAA